MTFETLVGCDEAARHLDDPSWVLIDCTAVLGQPDAGRAAHRERRLPGATHAHLEDDLSGPILPGLTGRHPLPDEHEFAATAGRLGVGDGVQVVAYDAGSGALAAARLWWLLKWAGHDAVAVLDGGLARWLHAGLPTETGPATPPRARPFHARYRPELVADAECVAQHTGTLIDARAEDRFRGENELIDPVAGHIPGAVCRPFTGNLRPDGTFADAADLRRRFPDANPATTTFYCGSGVTAAHDVLAFAVAGLGIARLYPGSWSEWITDPARPVATGPR
jgi:thiosulfate/3-mercaptopyruvate sulfurtransferase